MDVFKNKVGRPSNSIKKKRKIIIFSVIFLIILLLFLTVRLVVLYANNINKLKASTDDKLLNLTCPTKVAVNSQFICTTDQAGATISIPSKNLADGYVSRTNSKIIKIKYLKTGNAKVTISKSGYKSVSKTVEIVNGKDGLKLNCPKSVYVGEKFICTTNSTKSVVRVSTKGLSDHYLELLKNSNGMFKTPKKEVNLMYTNSGYATVIAEQGEFKPITQKVEIKLRGGLKLNCPESALVGQKFTCKTNSTKAVARVSTGGLSSHYLELLKKNNGKFKTPKKEINLSYTKVGYAKIVLEQQGFNPVTKHVEIINTKVNVKYNNNVVENLAAFIGSEVGGYPEGFEAQLITGAIFINNMYSSCGRKPFVTSPNQINTNTMCSMFSYQNYYSSQYCGYTLNKVSVTEKEKEQLRIAAKLILSGIFSIPKQVDGQGKLSNWMYNGQLVAKKWGSVALKKGCKIDEWNEDNCSMVFAYDKSCVSGSLTNKDVNGNVVSTNFNEYGAIANKLYKKYVTNKEKIY